MPISTETPKEVNYRLPLADLVAVGKALYVANEQYLEHEGLTADENDAVQRAFDAIDTCLEELVGPEWLGGLADEKAEQGIFPELDNVTQFSDLVRRMK